VAKKRIYNIAKEKGLTSQELLASLQAAGLDVTTSASGVEEAEVERVLGGKSGGRSGARTAAKQTKAPAAKAKGESGKAPAAKNKEEAVKKPAAKAKKSPAKATKSLATAPAAKSMSGSSKKAAAEGQPKDTASVKPAPRKTRKADAKAEPEAAKPEKQVVKRHPGATPEQESGASEEATGAASRSAASDRSGSVAATTEAPKIAGGGAAPVQRGGGAHAAQRETAAAAARGAGPRPEAVGGIGRKPLRPRGRGPRLDDMPTVVGPGVPLRKGVKPSGTVVSKEEAARIQAEKEAKAEAARKAAEAGASAPTQAGARPESDGLGASPRPQGTGGKPRPGFGRPAGERKDRQGRTASMPIPDIWVEAAEATGLVGPGRAAGPSRVRRGDDKPAKRRVIIDSQAGRKGGKGGSRDRRGGPVGEVDKPLQKKKAPPGTESPVMVKSGASVKDLSEALEIGAGDLIKTMLKLGEMVTITQSLSDDAIMILAEEFERQVEIEHAEEEKEGPEAFVDDTADLTPRAPVVPIMGHVDHGKTSLLDAIRETEVVKGEAGGITQHIGAYQVTHNDRKVTFLDTPGHEAFTAMRARGAKSTDIAVIVVAANDGVMPQTLEAISHAKAAEVPIVVAVNKMDLADANPDRVKKQLADEGLVPEDWGGDTVVVEVSAKQRLNLDELMDMILLVAEVQELQANANAAASGVVIESQLDVGRGPVATILVQRGTLRVGDSVVSGEAYGKVKAMFDFTGTPLAKASPSVPAQVLGFSTLPAAGDFVTVVKDEREARQRAEQRTARLRQEQLARSRGGASSLEEFHRRLKEGRVKELPLVIKGDVAGSVEALEEALRNVSHPEVKVAIVFAGVGGINESDIMLAAASKAVVIGFNVRPSAAAKTLAEQEQVDVRTYRVIYKAIEDVEAALVGML
jgi:translation initiation factor IF-2